MPVGQPEFIENPENRCPVILLLDTSTSMIGDPIEKLMHGVRVFKEEVHRDTKASLSVEVAVVSFGPVTLLQDFVTVESFSPPSLEAEGFTPMGEAIDFSLDLLESRKQTYRDNGVQYYRPWIFMITDGAPTDDWQAAADRLQAGEAGGKYSFFSVAVEGADVQKLKQISPPDRPPLMLNGLDFQGLFLWLSSSMKRVSSGKVGETLVLPPVGWGQVVI